MKSVEETSREITLIGNFYNCSDGKAFFEDEESFNPEDFENSINDFENLPQWAVDILTQFGLPVERMNIYLLNPDDPDTKTTIETYIDAMQEIQNKMNFRKFMNKTPENYAGFEKHGNLYTYKLSIEMVRAYAASGDPETYLTPALYCFCTNLREFFHNIGSLVASHAPDAFRTVEKIELRDGVFVISADLFSS